MREIDEQRYLWLFRIFGIFLVISIFLNIVLLVAFSKISPEPKRELFFVSSQNGNVENVYITKTNNQSFDISQDSVGYEIAKSYISEYIVERESLYSDRVKMSELFGLNGNLYFLSSKSVYEKFISSEEYRTALINKNKEVKVVNIEKLDYQPKSNKWIAEISIKTTNILGVNPEITTKIISITCDFTTKPVVKNAKNMWINPLGFEITSYEYVKN
ncbi:MAG: type IV secretion system protein [bacterium]|nr:type IV secretion system protein [bacterium]